MHKMFSKILTAIFPIIIITIVLFAHVSCAEGTGGSVGGVVIDAPEKLLEAEIVGRVLHESEPVVGATVSVKGYEFSAVTDKAGRFRLEFKTMTKMGVTKKRVQIEASAEGLRTRTKGVFVEQKRITTVDIELLPRY